MSSITEILKLKGDKKILPVYDGVVIEGGGTYKDHEYLIVFTEQGHRCGYVALKPEETERFEKDSEGEGRKYYYPDLDCHGGLTFYSRHHGAKELLPISCDDMWVGFDAAHAWDKPDNKTSTEYFGETKWTKYREINPMPCFEDVIHRTYDYMEQECKGIIDQLLQVAA
jgi:hypothetical protein